MVWLYRNLIVINVQQKLLFTIFNNLLHMHSYKPTFIFILFSLPHFYHTLPNAHELS